MFFAQSQLVMGYITQKVAISSGIAITIPGAVNLLEADVQTVSPAAAAIPRELESRNLASDTTSASTTYASVPELAMTTNRLGTYAFDYFLRYTTSDVTEGIGVRLAFSGAASNINYAVEAYIDLATRANLVVASSFGSALAAYSAGPGPGVTVPIRITGSCVVETVGTFNVQFRAETGGAQNATLRLGSYGNLVQQPT